MNLPGTCASPSNLDWMNVTVRGTNCLGPIAEAFEIYVWDAITVELAQRADPIPHSSRQNGEVRALRQSPIAFQFGGCYKADKESSLIQVRRRKGKRERHRIYFCEMHLLTTGPESLASELFKRLSQVFPGGRFTSNKCISKWKG